MYTTGSKIRHLILESLSADAIFDSSFSSPPEMVVSTWKFGSRSPVLLLLFAGVLYGEKSAILLSETPVREINTTEQLEA